MTIPLLYLCTGWGAATASDGCIFDPTIGQIICVAAGGGRVTAPVASDDPGLRYVYPSTDPVIGDCYYWSNVPGGLDAWDPANDPAVIAVTTTLPLCPAIPAVDPQIRAWAILRSWDLAPPHPAITPPDAGITGLPSHVSASSPPAITADETLPDGRILSVRAVVTRLAVDWGDGATTLHDPAAAAGYPDGTVYHVYTTKTCTPTYRRTHPSGGLCHPTLEYYTITATYRWTGEYSVGGAWFALGDLDRTTAATYDVDEARGVNVP